MSDLILLLSRYRPYASNRGKRIGRRFLITESSVVPDAVAENPNEGFKHAKARLLLCCDAD
jgi:hypothetical protein